MKIFYIAILFLGFNLSAISQNFTLAELQNLNTLTWKNCEHILKVKGYSFSEFDEGSKITRIYNYQHNNINNNALNYVTVYKCVANECGGINSFVSWKTPKKANISSIIKQLKSTNLIMVEQKKDDDAETYEYKTALKRVFLKSQENINKYVITVDMLNY